MPSSNTPSLNRRNLALGAVAGGASLLFGTSASAIPAASESDTILDVRKLGALGDGKTDDTKILQQAIDSAAQTGGAVFIPPGVYLTHELHMRPGVSLSGIAAWNYSGPAGNPGGQIGGSVLQLASGDAKGLLNMTDARGATVEGLTLDGRNLGKDLHGIFTDRTAYPKHEDGFRIERCQVVHFSGDGLSLSHVWCFSVRHSMFGYNQGDGMSLRGWDGFILDNWFSGNARAGFAARYENASVTFTGNRIEWNAEENLLITGGDGYQITGNFFDRAGTVGLALRKGRGPCTQFAITGNFFKRAGKNADPASQDSAQIWLDGATGVTLTGNNIQAGRDDGDKGVYSPAYGIVLRGLENCAIGNNVLHNGALRQLILDLGGHGEGLMLLNNPGRLLVEKH
jgi:Pectate lyase superfamily protein